jgi:2-phosphosulfolactate phosphatase
MDGETPDFAGVRDRVLSSSGADRLRRLGQTDDLEWCTTLDSHDVVPVVRLDEPPRAVRFEIR